MLRGPIKVLDFRMYLDDLDSLRLTENGIHEPEETSFFQRTIQYGDSIVDIGAMIGYYSLLFAYLIGPNGKVFSFEPEPKNFTILKCNIELNQLQNVNAFRYAILERSGPANLFISAENKGDHRCFNSGGWPSIGVESMGLDSCKFLNDQQINFVKIDTQGAELKVLRGMENFLQQHKETKLMIEFAPWWLHGMGTNPKDVLMFLAEKDFAFFYANGTEISASKLLERFPITSQNFTNLICLRRNSNA